MRDRRSATRPFQPCILERQQRRIAVIAPAPANCHYRPTDGRWSRQNCPQAAVRSPATLAATFISRARMICRPEATRSGAPGHPVFALTWTSQPLLRCSRSRLMALDLLSVPRRGAVCLLARWSRFVPDSLDLKLGRHRPCVRMGVSHCLQGSRKARARSVRYRTCVTMAMP